MTLRACLDCGRTTPRKRCSACASAHRQARKRAGRTGERGSTRASRRRRARVLERAQHRCFYCGARATVADHYVPLALGGADDEGNLVASCEPCNRAKGAMSPHEFMASR